MHCILQIQALLQIAGVGLMVTVISQILTKAGREDLATLTCVTGLILVLLLVVSMAGELLRQVQAIFSLS